MFRTPILALSALLIATASFAAETKAPPPSSSGEEVEVEKIKEKYWARGEEADVGVVQNRLYSKRHKFEVGLLFGNINGDPFLSTYTLGFTAGYNFLEFFGAHLVAWNAFTSGSSALTTLQGPPTNSTADTNFPKYYVGGELRGSLLYGKLSLVGKAILYLDAYLSGGGGAIVTESGPDALLYLGIGQQIHLTQWLSLNLDYRLMRYDETIIGKTPSDLGQVRGTRTNLSGMVTLGTSFYF